MDIESMSLALPNYERDLKKLNPDLNIDKMF